MSRRRITSPQELLERNLVPDEVMLHPEVLEARRFQHDNIVKYGPDLNSSDKGKRQHAELALGNRNVSLNETYWRIATAWLEFNAVYVEE